MRGLWKYVVGALVVVAIAANAKDVVRYLRISAM